MRRRCKKGGKWKEEGNSLMRQEQIRLTCWTHVAVFCVRSPMSFLCVVLPEQDQGCLPGLVLFLDNESTAVVETAVEVSFKALRLTMSGLGPVCGQATVSETNRYCSRVCK